MVNSSVSTKDWRSDLDVIFCHIKDDPNACIESILTVCLEYAKLCCDSIMSISNKEVDFQTILRCIELCRDIGEHSKSIQQGLTKEMLNKQVLMHLGACFLVCRDKITLKYSYQALSDIYKWECTKKYPIHTTQLSTVLDNIRKLYKQHDKNIYTEMLEPSKGNNYSNNLLRADSCSALDESEAGKLIPKLKKLTDRMKNNCVKGSDSHLQNSLIRKFDHRLKKIFEKSEEEKLSETQQSEIQNCIEIKESCLGKMNYPFK